MPSWRNATLRSLSGMLVAATISSAVLAADARPVPGFAEAGVPFLQEHCVGCHSGSKPEAGLSLVQFRDDASVTKQRERWKTVIGMVETGGMPPEGEPQPTADERDAFLRAVRGVFERAARDAKPDPGRVTMRRLNRTEYRNTIRDLIGVDFDPTEDFPSDDIGHGFDNIGDVLTMSPVLMERYLAAAESIMQRAIVANPPPPVKRHLATIYTEPAGSNVPREGKFRPITTEASDSPILTGPLHAPYQWQEDGEYIFRTRVYVQTSGRQPVRVAVLVTGADLPEAVADAEADRLSGLAVKSLRPLKILKQFEVRADNPEKAEVLEVTVPALPGRQRMSVAIVKPPEGEPPAKLYVEYFALEGPLDTRPASQRRLLACSAGATQSEQTREVLRRFAARAYRRPPSSEEVERLAGLAESAVKGGQSWEAAVQLAMQAVLCSPKFLFRAELDDRPDRPDVRPLDEYQLASRLSYFLWSTMPDEALTDLAAKNQLRANLDAQANRMLQDPKSESLVENFALQWLQLKRLDSFAPDPQRFPQFSSRLRSSMLEETKRFFASVVREDRSIVDLLDADYTFLNEGLARHYGIIDTQGTRAGQKPVRPGGQPIRGNDFVRVALADSERGGLLTQASVLTVTSNPTRTSPVKRGRWVLEQILGTPPPPPPPNVPLLPEGEQAELTGSLRQRFEQHRSNPVCANCHARMDPIGFAFENYDAVGAFRTKDGAFDIDPAGQLPDGRSFQSWAELKLILKDQKDLFARCLSEKMLIYALGRGLEYYDQPAVDRIVTALQSDNYRFSRLVREIARSEPFQKRRG